MKPRIPQGKWLYLVLLGVFILGQLLGSLAIRAYFIRNKMEELKPQVSAIARDLGAGRQDFSRKTDHILQAYDMYGSPMAIFVEEETKLLPMLDFGIHDYLMDFIPKVIGGNIIATLEAIPGLPSRSIIIGMPIINNANHIVGAVFMLKPASDYTAALQGFYLVFFIAISVAAAIILVFLNWYLRKAKELELVRREYVANISHELKSPLASIKALTETLADHVVDSEETKDRYYDIMLMESARLEKLITDMLELSRLQSAGTAFERQAVDIRSVMRQVQAKFSMIAEDLEVDFKVTENALNLPVVLSNTDRLQQVLFILIDNAFKFSNPQGGRVIIDAKVSSREVVIQVQDNGPGIESSALPFLFDRFYKADKARNSPGSGLGLAIAKAILDQLGERIEVSSKLGEGSTFSFSIRRG